MRPWPHAALYRLRTPFKFFGVLTRARLGKQLRKLRNLAGRATQHSVRLEFIFGIPRDNGPRCLGHARSSGDQGVDVYADSLLSLRRSAWRARRYLDRLQAAVRG